MEEGVVEGIDSDTVKLDAESANETGLKFDFGIEVGREFGKHKSDESAKEVENKEATEDVGQQVACSPLGH